MDYEELLAHQSISLVRSHNFLQIKPLGHVLAIKSSPKGSYCVLQTNGLP
jgi:hypothetical protein